MRLLLGMSLAARNMSANANQNPACWLRDEVTLQKLAAHFGVDGDSASATFSRFTHDQIPGGYKSYLGAR